MSNQSGVLYVVATPIGNLDDISDRARRVLAGVKIVAAEDTRRSRILMEHLGISARMVSCHDHNESKAAGNLLSELRTGHDVALISDAGTPLISDPGYRLVSRARAEGIRVVPVPGPCAAIAALSAAGLPTDRFVFEGYVSERPTARRRRLDELKGESRTLVFYESPHRIGAFIDDALAAFGPDRRIVLARELTKKFESIHGGNLADIPAWLAADPDRSRGEIVIIIEGRDPAPQLSTDQQERLLGILLTRLSVKEAAAATAEFSGGRKRDLYELALKLRER